MEPDDGAAGLAQFARCFGQGGQLRHGLKESLKLLAERGVMDGVELEIAPEVGVHGRAVEQKCWENALGKFLALKNSRQGARHRRVVQSEERLATPRRC